MICEYCSTVYENVYGSGRFCCKKCASGFSTKAKREIINEKVSNKLKGRPGNGRGGFKKGFDPNRATFFKDPAIRAKATLSRIKNYSEKLSKLSWIDLPFNKKRKQILKEQHYSCLICGIKEWMGESIMIEIDHLNGIKADNRRENLRGLCPNCHSQTPTFRTRKRIPDELNRYIIEQTNKNIL
jgi:hypothetical protein